MSQTRKHSMFETLVGTAIGFALSMLLAHLVYPLFGHQFTFGQNLSITVIFTLASIARGYGVRRLFNHLGRRHVEN